MTLNQTWKNCLRMWKWIDKVWKPGMDIVLLKREWMKKWAPDVDIDADCFFCGYVEEHYDTMITFCTQCPGRLVNKRFDCHNTTYHYWGNPKKFYQKLLQLDAKRRGV